MQVETSLATCILRSWDSICFSNLMYSLVFVVANLEMETGTVVFTAVLSVDCWMQAMGDY